MDTMKKKQKITRRNITFRGIEVSNVPVIVANEFQLDDYVLSGRVMDNVLRMLLKNEQQNHKKDSIDYLKFFPEPQEQDSL